MTKIELLEQGIFNTHLRIYELNSLLDSLEEQYQAEKDRLAEETENETN